VQSPSDTVKKPIFSGLDLCFQSMAWPPVFSAWITQPENADELASLAQARSRPLPATCRGQPTCSHCSLFNAPRVRRMTCRQATAAKGGVVARPAVRLTWTAWR